MLPKHNLFFDIAKRVAQESHATRLKVGAVIVKDNRVLATGYNGTPPGYHTNKCEIYDSQARLVTNPVVIHAEMNAIIQIAKSTLSCEGTTMYTTHAPCELCAKLVASVGIKELLYAEVYANGNLKGVDLLNQLGVYTSLGA